MVASAHLADLTTLGVGGKVARFEEPSDTQTLSQFLAFASDNGLPVACIGRGSNVLAHDRGWPGALIRIGSKMKGIRRANDVLVVGAGHQLASLVRYCSAQGLLDLTQCVGIPGTVGGAVTMNAGTQWGEISSCVRWVECIDINSGSLVRYSRKELGFGYRTSTIQGAELIATTIGFELSDVGASSISRLMKERLQARVRTSIPVSGCAGSFFVNPQNTHAGTLIDRCDLKGIRIGGANR